MLDRSFEGGCACGSVRYVARGAPRNETLCHCSDCRRAAGAPVVGWVTFRTREVEWTGTPKHRRSSDRATRSFCGECGTALTYQLLSEPELVDLTLGSLDDPNAIAPKDHTDTQSQLDWLTFADGLPRFATTREAG
jgi:hypothetical protein